MAGGRPTSLNDELVAEALKLAQAGVPKQIIADLIGVSRSTFKYWLQLGSDGYTPRPGAKKPPADLKPYQEFSAAFARARGKAIALCEATWMRAIQNGDASQAAHWLKVHEPDLYKDSSDVNVTGQIQAEGVVEALKLYQGVIDRLKSESDGG